MEQFFKTLNILNTNNIDIKEYSALTLAYIGDSIFEICVRTYVLSEGNMQSNKLHNKAKKLVSATAQSKMYSILEEITNEEEFNILKRGRNAKSYSTAKNANVNDYRRATGVEALFGYLYIKGDYTRITELFKHCLDIL